MNCRMTAPNTDTTAPAANASCRTALRLDLKRGHLHRTLNVLDFEGINFNGLHLFLLLKHLLFIWILSRFAPFASFAHSTHFALLSGKCIVGEDLLVDS